MRTFFLATATLILLAVAQSGAADSERLAGVLAAQPADVQARYQYRHPLETLEFFGVEPGMTVVEALPGGGWYTKILLDYVGPDGTVIGANYAVDMWPLFGFFSDEFIESTKTWVDDWPAGAEDWRGDDSAGVKAFELGSMPAEFEGTVDVVLFIRALHNMARFEEKGGYLTAAIADAHRALKPGGIVGIVQHQARDDMPDAWAGGQNGYLKRDFVIEQMERAGFEFVADSDINHNDRDRPTQSDVVWRLPPGLNGSENDPERRAQMVAIGESNRMTLKFRKKD